MRNFKELFNKFIRNKRLLRFIAVSLVFIAIIIAIAVPLALHKKKEVPKEPTSVDVVLGKPPSPKNELVSTTKSIELYK